MGTAIIKGCINKFHFFNITLKLTIYYRYCFLLKNLHEIIIGI